MGTELSVDIGALHGAASAIHTAAIDARDEFGKQRNVLTEAGSTLFANSRAALVDAAERWHRELTAFTAQAEEFTRKVHTAGQQFQAQDMAQAGRLGTIAPVQNLLLNL